MSTDTLSRWYQGWSNWVAIAMLVTTLCSCLNDCFNMLMTPNCIGLRWSPNHYVGVFSCLWFFQSKGLQYKPSSTPVTNIEVANFVHVPTSYFWLFHLREWAKHIFMLDILNIFEILLKSKISLKLVVRYTLAQFPM